MSGRLSFEERFRHNLKHWGDRQVDEVNDDTKNWKGDVEVTIQHHGALEKTIRWKQKQEYAFSIFDSKNRRERKSHFMKEILRGGDNYYEWLF